MIHTQYPYIDDNGRTHETLIKTWTDDETKTLLQVETGAMYDEAIDLYPCAYTYEEIDKPIEEEEDTEDGEEQQQS